MNTEFEGLLRALSESQVDFILIGGLAATVHGSARATYDIDIVYSRSEPNIERLASALATLQPYLRGAPAGLPFRFDVPTIRRGLNFTLSTYLGALDIFGEISGGGSFEDLLGDTVTISLFGHECRCLSLDRLIQVKRAAGRPKDLEAIAELEALREERGDNPG